MGYVWCLMYRNTTVSGILGRYDNAEYTRLDFLHRAEVSCGRPLWHFLGEISRLLFSAETQLFAESGRFFA